MNKIKVIEDVVDSNISKKITFSLEPSHQEFEITKLHITILKSCDLELSLVSLAKKWKVDITISPSAQVHLYLYQSLEKSKVQYNFWLHQNSLLTVYKFQEKPVAKEMMAAHLQEEGANLQYYFKDIAQEKETFDYYVYHDAPKTISNLKNNLVTVKEGKILLQVSTFIPKANKKCIANQGNRIIDLNDKKNEIRPNLYIDEYDVDASHSALIGKFDYEELFYLQSRGIAIPEASRLLLKGFLLSDISNSKMSKAIESAIKKEWR